MPNCLYRGNLTALLGVEGTYHQNGVPENTNCSWIHLLRSCEHPWQSRWRPVRGWVLGSLFLAPLPYRWGWGLLYHLHSPDWLASFTLNLRGLLLNPECWFSLLTKEIDYMCSHSSGVVYELNNITIYVGAPLGQLTGRSNTNTNIIVNWLNYIDHTPPPLGTGGYPQRQSCWVAWLPSS